MARIITKEHALKIRDKLGARIMPERGSAHDVYGIYYNEQLVASFGIRRGSEKGQGHDHIPHAINVSPNFAKQIALCGKYLEDYLERLRQSGYLPPEAEFQDTA